MKIQRCCQRAHSVWDIPLFMEDIRAVFDRIRGKWTM